MIDLGILVRLANSFFTIAIGLVLANMYLKKTMRFVSLLAWSMGFIFYGCEILLRVWSSWAAVEVFILSILMGLLFVLGTSNLMKKNRIYGVVSLIIVSVLVFLFPAGNWYRVAAFVFFGLMTIAVFHLRFSVGKVADRFIAGWLILLISNILFTALFDLEWVADSLAIPAKGLLALGMLDQRFARFVLDIKKLYNPP